jgi:geranylgeranyl diphosphate synthase type II
MKLADYARLVDAQLERVFEEENNWRPDGHDVPPLLWQSMKYSVIAGGKRLRPAMLLAAVDMLGGDRAEAMPFALAIEMIHAYSLVHDDLPGMDNDSIRRGKPTNHVVFGVGHAILAGDGLLNYAYEMMLDYALSSPERILQRTRAAHEIARGAGIRGMIAGQSLDLSCEQGAVEGDFAMLRYIHLHKTGSMFRGAMRAAARLCDAGDEKIKALSRFASSFGLMYQSVDDLLDVEGDEAVLGKTTGKDQASGKLTSVSVYGSGGTRALNIELQQDAMDALLPFGEQAAFFQDLLCDMMHRKT